MSKLSEVLKAQRSRRDEGSSSPPDRASMEVPHHENQLLATWLVKRRGLNAWLGEWFAHLSPEAQRRTVAVLALFPSFWLAMAMQPSPGRLNTFFWLTFLTLSLWGTYAKEPITASEQSSSKRPIYQRNTFTFSLAIGLPWLVVFGPNILFGFGNSKILMELFAGIAFVFAWGRWNAYAKTVREKGEAAIMKSLRKIFGATTEGNQK